MTCLKAPNRTTKFNFFFHRLGWFPIQGSRPACYCISGPRRIPAVGVTRHTPCAHCRTWVYPYQGDACPPHRHGSCVSESPSTARARRTPFGCKFKSGEVSSPTHPAHPDCPVSRHDTRNQRSPGALYKHNDAPTIYLQCVKGDTDVKARGSWSPSEARQPPHHCAPAPF